MTYVPSIFDVFSLPSTGLYLTGSRSPNLSVVRGEYCGVDGFNKLWVNFRSFCLLIVAVGAEKERVCRS